MSGQEKLIAELLEANCLKFGEFTLKTGSPSNYYIDMRESTLYPQLFRSLVEAVKSVITSDRYLVDQKVAIVGVPYGVVPIASAVAYELGHPYYPVRKETKDYGRKTDESLLRDHQFVLVEDVMSSGSSIIETIKKLEGKKVSDVIVIANREAGGQENLAREYPEIRLHSVLKADDLLKAKSS